MQGEPFFVYPPDILKNILNEFRKFDQFKSICFKVFIDEFENLSTGQQSFINRLRKHSHDLLSWNIAYKAHAQVSNEVSEPGEELFDGSQGEQLQKNHDYEEINLDKIINNLARSEKHLFFAKVLLATMDPDNYQETPDEYCLSFASGIFREYSAKHLVSEYVKQNPKFVDRAIKNQKYIEHLNEESIKLLKEDAVLIVALAAISKHKTFDPDILTRYLNNKLTDSELKSFNEKLIIICMREYLN